VAGPGEGAAVKLYFSGVIDGTALAFERAGTGPPLVLIHGLGGPAMWERVAPILAERFDLLIPHLPGFGESPPAARPCRARDHAALLAGHLDALALRAVTVAGISWGGEIAALLAASRPAAVRSLFLLCPTGTRRYPAPLRSHGLRRAMLPLVGRGLANPRIAEALSRRSFHDPGVRPPDLVTRYLDRLRQAGRLDALLDAIEDIWSSDRGLPPLLAASVSMPLTLIWGARDRTVPVEYAQPLVDSRPDAELVVVPDCGHSLPLERPDVLSKIISDRVPRSA
jgi:pimeloyl-ACP methyl ester carboxylesterase